MHPKAVQPKNLIKNILKKNTQRENFFLSRPLRCTLNTFSINEATFSRVWYELRYNRFNFSNTPSASYFRFIFFPNIIVFIDYSKPSHLPLFTSYINWTLPTHKHQLSPKPNPNSIFCSSCSLSLLFPLIPPPSSFKSFFLSKPHRPLPPLSAPSPIFPFFQSHSLSSTPPYSSPLCIAPHFCRIPQLTLTSPPTIYNPSFYPICFSLQPDPPSSPPSYKPQR